MLPRRALLASFLALAASRSTAPAVAHVGGDPLPDFSGLWSTLPLPYTPGEAWRSLPNSVQAEIGTAVIAMALGEYVAGDMHADADRFRDKALRERGHDVHDAMLNQIPARVWQLFPDLFGPEGDHPAWALKNGFAR